MEHKNTKSLKGEITEGLQKGQTAEGEIVKITQDVASGYMTPEQVEKRQVNHDDPFAEVTIKVEGVEVTRTFKDYSMIGAGGIPENSTMGKIITICDIEVGGSVPMIAKETTGRQDENGNRSKFVVWDIIGL